MEGIRNRAHESRDSPHHIVFHASIGVEDEVAAKLSKIESIKRGIRHQRSLDNAFPTWAKRK
jgi:hypothetical protein